MSIFTARRRWTPLARYRLGRAALGHREFMAAELADATGVAINTVYGFIAELGDRVKASPAFSADGSRGAPRKLYRLTREGVDYLAEQNLVLARLLRERDADDRVAASVRAGQARTDTPVATHTIDVVREVRETQTRLRERIAQVRQQAASSGVQELYDAVIAAGEEQLVQAKAALLKQRFEEMKRSQKTAALPKVTSVHRRRRAKKFNEDKAKA
jgi:hypothetical protein